MAVVVLPTPPFWFAIAMTLAKEYHLALNARSRDDSILTGREGGVVLRCYRSLLRAAELIHKTSELFTDSVDKPRMSSTIRMSCH
jgi:hypothetical protein